MARIRSFKAVVDRRSCVLILGTMPGPEALRRKEYYGFPLNHFWKILPEIFGESPFHSYPEKIKFLKRNRIALWDVLRSCRREGAADQKIREEIPNDIPGLLRRFPNIETIYLNGRLAQKLFQKYFTGKVRQPVYYLPSTSPAHASLSFDSKVEKWLRVSQKFARNWC